MSFYSFDNTDLRYLDLKDFDFSCQSQVELYDLSNPDIGNVRSAFVQYTSTFNSELVRYIFGVYSSYGIPTSDEAIEKIIAFPESTTCTDVAAGSGGVSGDAGAGGASIAESGGRGAGQAQSNSGTGGSASGTGSGGTAGIGKGPSAVGESSGCSCRLGDARGAHGPGAYLLFLGMVARYRARRRARLGR